MTNSEIEERVKGLQGKIDSGLDMDGAEMQDVVNNDDVVVGSLPRGVIWDNGLENHTRVVNIFVKNENGEVLLPVRSAKKRYLPGGYDFSCGENVLSGEDYYEAALRGVEEELGILGELVEEGVFSPDEGRGLFCFGKVYSLLINSDQQVRVNTDEIDRIEWKAVEQIRELLRVNSGKFKRDYKSLFEMVFGE